MRDLFRERCRNEEVKVFLIIGPNVGDRILRNPSSLNYPRDEVSVLLRRDPNAVRVSDGVRKALQQLG